VADRADIEATKPSLAQHRLGSVEEHAVVVGAGTTHATILEEQAGALIDGLSTPADALWPHERWPRLRLDGPLRVRIDFRTSVTRIELRNEEIVSLWLAAELARRAQGLPWSRSVSAALDRVLAALPEARRRTLRALLRRVVVGAPATEATRAGAKPPSQDVVGTFEEAFTSRRGLGFDYVDRAGRVTSRLVEPHGLLVQPPVWYILAFDPTRAEPRMFRMDRIAHPRVSGGMTFTPRQDVIDALRS